MRQLTEQPPDSAKMTIPPTTRHVTAEDLSTLIQHIRKFAPSAGLFFKTDSYLQRLIGWLVRPFNPTYMTHYTTVMGGKIWLPNREFLEQHSNEWLFELLCHEAVHLRDMAQYPGFFQVSYVALLPTGLTFRALWEWRAYKVSLAAQYAVYGVIPSGYIEHIATRFTGPTYLFMWPFRNHIRRALRRECSRLTKLDRDHLFEMLLTQRLL